MLASPPVARPAPSASASLSQPHRCPAAAARCGQRAAGRALVLRAAENKTVEAATVDGNVLEFCDVNQRVRSLGEKEQDFLMALQAFYAGEPPAMSNEEFDNLKQELTWEGSTVVVMDSTEQRFLEASLAYQRGQPVLSDAQYDALKAELKAAGSRVAMAGPRCSLRSQRVYSDASVDYIRMTALNLPGALLALAACFVVDDLSGFGITQLVELPEPFSFIATWFIVLPVIYLVSSKLTSLLLQDSVVLRAPCPSCGAQNIAFFGDILFVEGSKESLDCTCEACKSSINFQRKSRTVVLIPAKS